MTARQLAILNSLVTYAAENVPGGLSDDEREVAQIVGGWALAGTSLGRVKYTPVFVGFTEENEKIVVYKDVDNPSQFHIRRPDGKLVALGEGALVETWFDQGLSAFDSEHYQIKITSLMWNGSAKGTRHDLIAEDPIRIFPGEILTPNA